jgi:uncharacterized membrane protein
MSFRAAILLAALAGTATAQPLPWLFGVAGVGAGDVLNVRELPDAGSAKVGTLAADAVGIEVVERDPSGRWGKVNAGERSGWVAMRYLAPEPAVWATGAVPANLACLGTEPFWSLRTAPGEVRLETPDAPVERLPLAAILDSGIERDPRRVLSAGEGAESLTAVMLPMACSDGMSERSYGLDVTLVLGEAPPRMLTGCCSIAPRGE